MYQKRYHNFTSPLRYPGGKGTLANFMKLVIEENNLLDSEYVEVYGGGAAIAWELLFSEYVRRVHINDVDKTVMSFWSACLETTDDLCKFIFDTNIDIDEWNKQKMIHKHHESHSSMEIAFSTFFLNRTNRSGILDGGIIGGKQQLGTWKLDARFNKRDLIERVQRIARYKDRITLYNLDAIEFIDGKLGNMKDRTLIYLDPPYFNKGQELYRNRYTRDDHRNIANRVQQQIRQFWIVSYDATDEVFDLYRGRRKTRYSINYSAQARYAGSEVMFFSDRLRIPDVDNPAAVKLGRQKGRR